MSVAKKFPKGLSTGYCSQLQLEIERLIHPKRNERHDFQKSEIFSEGCGSNGSILDSMKILMVASISY